MFSKNPHITKYCHRIDWNLWHRILIGQARLDLHRHQRRDLLVGKPHQVQIKPKITQLTQLERQQLVVPASVQSQLVVGDDVGTLLGIGPARSHHDRQ